LEELEKEALSVDELSRKLTTDVVIVGQYLSELALRGLVEEVGDKYVLGS
jgi:Mn-dependent DtxR family transcriptional regulator